MFILCLLIYSSENVYSIYEPKELLELKRCKSKLQIEYSIEEGRLNSHVYPPSLPSPQCTVIKWIKGYRLRRTKRTEGGFSRRTVWINHWMMESEWKCRHWFYRTEESRPYAHVGSAITIVEAVHTAEPWKCLVHCWDGRWRVETWGWTRDYGIRLYKLILSPRNRTLTTRSFQLFKTHHEQSTNAYKTPTFPIVTTGDWSFI